MSNLSSTSHKIMAQNLLEIDCFKSIQSVKKLVIPFNFLEKCKKKKGKRNSFFPLNIYALCKLIDFRSVYVLHP